MTECQVLITLVAFFGGISSLLLWAGWSWLRLERKRIHREHSAKLARERSGLRPA